MEYAVIMAGGSGTRLWPMSRTNRPKQVLPLVEGKSLLQLSYERMLGVVAPERIFVSTARAYAEAVFAALPQLPRENLIGEPVGRDTANAVGLSAALLLKRDPDAVAAVVTADHVIRPVSRFHEAVRAAFGVVGKRPDALVTFGIVPTHGHTGLGYIHKGEPMDAGTANGAYHVLGFKEKPDKATADRYVESARYYWNSGMFVWRCDTVLNELQRHLPESHKAVSRIADAWNTPARQQVLDELYPSLPRISVDFAILEPVSQGKGKAQIVTVEMPVEWLDIGSWPALSETLASDDHDNAVACPLCVLMDSDDNIVVSDDPQRLIAAVGLSDMIVVSTKDVTLVCPKTEAQRVKDLVERVKEKYGDRFV